MDIFMLCPQAYPFCCHYSFISFGVFILHRKLLLFPHSGDILSGTAVYFSAKTFLGLEGRLHGRR
jgi:hypothetical protein